MYANSKGKKFEEKMANKSKKITDAEMKNRNEKKLETVTMNEKLRNEIPFRFVIIFIFYCFVSKLCCYHFISHIISYDF